MRIILAVLLTVGFVQILDVDAQTEPLTQTATVLENTD